MQTPCASNETWLDRNRAKRAFVAAHHARVAALSAVPSVGETQSEQLRAANRKLQLSRARMGSWLAAARLELSTHQPNTYARSLS